MSRGPHEPSLQRMPQTLHFALLSEDRLDVQFVTGNVLIFAKKTSVKQYLFLKQLYEIFVPIVSSNTRYLLKEIAAP